MNPLPGEIFLDNDFPTRSGGTQPVYIVVVGEVPYVEGSVLFVMLNPAKGPTHFAGPDWEWPERFIVPARLNSLNIAAELLIDDVYVAKTSSLLRACSQVGHIDREMTGELLWAICESPGIPGIYCVALEAIAARLTPDPRRN